MPDAEIWEDYEKVLLEWEDNGSVKNVFRCT